MPFPVHCHFRSIPASGVGVPRHFRCHSLARFGCAGLATPAPLTTDKTTDLLAATWIVERTVSSLAGRIALESSPLLEGVSRERCCCSFYGQVGEVAASMWGTERLAG